MVPGSTFRYGSSFCMDTETPRLLSSLPIDAAVTPLPRPLTTPPVTKMYAVTLTPIITLRFFEVS